MNSQNIKITLFRTIEMLAACMLLSVIVCALCISGLMPVGSIQRDVTLFGAPIVFILFNIIMMRKCYVFFNGENIYYFINIIAYGLFALINLYAYKSFEVDNYTWFFVVTRFARYSNLGIDSRTAIMIFHGIVSTSIFLAPIGLGWIKLAIQEEEELLEIAPDYLEVNPLEQKNED